MNIARIIAQRTASDIIACDVATPVSEVVQTLASKRIGALPVLRDGRVVGIVSERDVIYCIEAEGEASLSKKVGEVMTAPAITATPATKVDEALELMTRRRIRHLPVVDGGAMCGFVSIGDLVKSQVDDLAREAEAMRSYIQSA